MTNPTTKQAAAFQDLYEHFNQELFGGGLAPCLLNFSRKSNALGFFAPERWQTAGQPVHEISINPSYLSERTAQQTASTLVHEMVHLWQQEHGEPGRRGYHNREWAEKMEAVGLVPSNTGMPGGKRTGGRMTHYIPESGPFVDAWNALPPGVRESLFPYVCDENNATTARKTASRKSKTKYTCPECGLNVWAKPGANVGCWDCQVQMEEQE